MLVSFPPNFQWVKEWQKNFVSPTTRTHTPIEGGYSTAENLPRCLLPQIKSRHPVPLWCIVHSSTCGNTLSTPDQSEKYKVGPYQPVINLYVISRVKQVYCNRGTPDQPEKYIVNPLSFHGFGNSVAFLQSFA